MRSESILNEIFNIRQNYYNKHSYNDYNKDRIVSYQNIDDQVKSFFVSGSKLIYPAKSYFVSIVYALKLHKLTKVNILTILSRDDLLLEDEFFKPYTNSIDSDYIYISTLKFLKEYRNLDINSNWIDYVLDMSSVVSTLFYFDQEFKEVISYLDKKKYAVNY